MEKIELLNNEPGLSYFHVNENVCNDDCNAGDAEKTH